MSENWEDQENDTPLVGDLRKQIKDLNKKLTEAEAAKSAAEGRFTERVLADTLNAKGVNPKAAKFLRADGVDATDEDAVAKWLDENSDLFPAKAPEGETPQQAQPSVDPQVVDGYQKLGSTSSLQRPADMNRLAEVDRSLPANATQEQVLAAYRAAGL